MSPRIDGRSAGETRFAYRALRIDGSEQRGEVAAPTLAGAREKVAILGLLPIELQGVAERFEAQGRIPVGDLALGLRLMSSLVNAGLPMDRTLATFAHVAPSSWTTQRLDALRAAVREGATLGHAMRDAGVPLPRHVRGMLDAAEAGGTLPSVLSDAAQLLEESNRQRAALRGALAYPALLALVGTVALGLLLGVVLPRFADLLHEVGQQLPLTARWLLGLSQIGLRWWLLLVGVAAVGSSSFARTYAADASFRRRVHEALLAAPLLGPVRFAAAGSRLTAALASMLSSGVPIATALAHCAHASGDEAIAHRVQNARDAVIRGERLSQAFAAEATVRPGMLQLIRAGEATGELPQMLRTAATIEAEWCAARVRAITGLIEPSLILGFGAVIAFVASALLQAVYAVRPA